MAFARLPGRTVVEYAEDFVAVLQIKTLGLKIERVEMHEARTKGHGF